MSAVPLVIVAVMLSLGMQQPSPSNATPPKPQPKPAPAATVPVQIVVGTQANHAAACKKGGAAPSTVFIVSAKEVYHCIGNTLRDHANHGKDPDMEKAVVRLGAGDRIRWVSATRFIVVSVERHETPGAAPAKKPVAPDFPFLTPFPKEFRNEVTSGAVRDEPGTIVQRYKASFNIEGIGLIDPDLICSM